MSQAYSASYNPPAPVLDVHLAAPGERPRIGPVSALVDTGSDGTLIPNDYLERVEAIGLSDAVLYGVLGEAREVELFEIDLYLGDLLLPGIVVVNNQQTDEILLGRNVLNKLALLLDGPNRATEIKPTRPIPR